MAYNDDKTWDDLVREAQIGTRNLIRALHEAEEVERNWNSFKGGDSDATIATALSKATAEVTELREAFEALKAIKDYANNQTPTQANYLARMRKFS